MSVTVEVNSLSISHKGSGGFSIATIPDICKTPTPGGPAPMPYPNTARSSDLSDGTTTVLADGDNMIAIKGSHYAMSVGDEPGTVGGVTSNTFKKETDWITYSFDVKFDGGNVCRLTDKKFHNHKNTVDAAGDIEPPLMAALGDGAAKKLCKAMCACKGAERKQDCVAKKFCKGGRVWPVHTPKQGDLLPEVTTSIPTQRGGSFDPLLSQTERYTPGGALAPMSIPKALSAGALAPGTTTRWDFIQVVDEAKPCTPDNVKNYIECKFPGDSLTDNQTKARQMMSKSDKSRTVLVTLKKCGCA